MEESINKEKNNTETNQGLVSLINLKFDITAIDINTLSPLTLAFIGDSVYDLVIRTIVVEKGNAPVKDLHLKCSNLVKASAQAKLYRNIKDELTGEETRIFKRGRNTKISSQAKNASKSSYRTATGLESLIGHLYLTDDFPRVLDLIKQGLKDEI